MPHWKKTIFVNAIKTRMRLEKKSAEEIILEYTKLTEEEKQEILAEI